MATKKKAATPEAPAHDPRNPPFGIIMGDGAVLSGALYAEEQIPCPCGKCGGEGTLQHELAMAFRVARAHEQVLAAAGLKMYADGFSRVMLTVLRARNVVLTVAPAPDAKLN